jgi:hypothetical protein
LTVPLLLLAHGNHLLLWTTSSVAARRSRGIRRTMQSSRRIGTAWKVKCRAWRGADRGRRPRVEAKHPRPPAEVWEAAE